MSITRYSQEVRLDDLNNVHTYAVLAVRPGSRVLDIGGADGSVARALNARGCRVTVVERDPEAVAAARAAGLEVVAGDVEALPDTSIAPAGVDVVLLLDVLEHLVQPQALLARAATWLAPGGVVMLSVPHVAHGAIRVSLLEGRFPRTDTGLLDRTHLHFFDRAGLDTLLTEAGLVPIDLLTVQRGLDQTEVPIDPARLAAGVRDAVEADPSARVYQFFVIARCGPPGPAGGGLLQAVTQRSRETEDAYRRLEAYATALAAALEPLRQLEERYRALADHTRHVEQEAARWQQEAEVRPTALDDLEIERETLMRLLGDRMAELEQAGDTIAVLQRDLEVQRSYAEALASQLPGIAARGGEAAVLTDLDAYRAVAETPAAAVALAGEARELHRLRATMALRLVARIDAWLRRRPTLRRLLRAATRGATRLIGGVRSSR